MADNIYTGNPCKRGHDGRRYKTSRSCVECVLSRSRQHNRDPKKRAYLALKDCRCRARNRGSECTLTEEWIAGHLQHGCQLTGLPFDFSTGPRNHRSPSVDRIDNSKGYTEDNCRVILWGLNAAFGTWGQEAFREITLAWLGVTEQQLVDSESKAA